MTVREATFDVMRRLGMTRIFGNPGSTEIPFLTDFPDDLEFVLALHEGAVVGMASGYAIGTGRPAFVNLHTAAGLGNAVNQIVCARDNRVPLVIVVGQQDRRQMGLSPFLTGRNLERLAGDYPVWTSLPAHAGEVPGAIARAWHEAQVNRGPAMVVVPMGDWDEEMDDTWARPAAPAKLLRAAGVEPEVVDEVAELVRASSTPAIVVGAGADSRACWDALVALAEKLACPVWQDTFSSRHGFPQDHPLFAGHMPWRRSELRAMFADHDLVLAVGTPAFRLYTFDAGRIVEEGTQLVVVADDPDDVLRSAADVGVLASPATVCAELAARVEQRTGTVESIARPAPPEAGPLSAAHVVQALADRLEPDTILVEEAPSTRPEILSRIATREPMGFVAVANGALGFGLSASIGLRMAVPDRPVLALLGDGSSMYTVQGLWSAAKYGVGVVFVILGNGRYAIMDELARMHGGEGAWPPFETLELATIARGLGCESQVVTTHEELAAALDAALPGLRERTTPLLIDTRLA